MRYDSITDVIGNTPLVRLDPAVHGLDGLDLYAKLEMLNPFGSIKDRAAWNMLAPRIDEARSAGSTVVELSSGNTAKALAVLAGMHGLEFRCVTNRMKVPEMKDLLLLLGATIEELPGQSECLDPSDLDDPLTRIHRTISEAGSAWLHTDQYFNHLNTRAHLVGTGPEIIKDLEGQPCDWLIACVGTAGSSTGASQALQEHNPQMEVIGIVADKSDFIPGIRNLDEVHEVGLFDPGNYDVIEAVTSQEAIDGMLALVRRYGLLAGPTAGAAYWGAVRYLRRAQADLNRTAGSSCRRRTAVLVLCDRIEPYLSYLRQRRPELFGRPPAPTSVRLVTDEEVSRVICLDVGLARDWIQAEHPLIVDLRSPHAFAAAHVPGSVNIVDEIFDELLRGGIPFDRHHPVLLVCPVGERSRRYAALLTRLGHQDARSLEGGVLAWRDADAPLSRT